MFLFLNSTERFDQMCVVPHQAANIVLLKNAQLDANKQ